MATQAAAQPIASSGRARAAMQKFGGFLAGMVMPNIPAFIAWGLITAFFIPTGWTPNAKLDQLVSPMVSFLIPVLIGFTGGRLVYGIRGGVVGAIATAGVAIGASQPMFIGAMVMGPLGGYLIKQFDRAVEGRIRAGFEMLVNTFSAGILGAVLAILGFLAVQPVMDRVSAWLGAAAVWVTNAHLLPLIAIFIEPGKVLFLNNAINHGILEPIGVEQAKETGKSIFFLLETDPGPGLGLLLAYWAFAKGAIRQSAPGAILIQFFGGIHEVYFPYVLMRPILVLAVILGGMAADTTFMLLHAGLVATPSPGSIFAEIAMTPKGGYVPVLSGIFVGALVSFLVASFFIRRARDEMDEGALAFAQAVVQDMKSQSKFAPSGQAAAPTPADQAGFEAQTLVRVPSAVYFACEAGMGSSAMGASILKKRLQEAGYDIPVHHVPVNQLPPTAEVVFTQASFETRAQQVAPKAKIYLVQNFLNKATYDQLIEDLERLKG
ncbi:PTS mannitol transporter subunit IICB [Alicyclobacillus sendaiensis]|uniref:PTS mannitol transporter subunit IICB n=1 Tax=Alicyclobacillus sendaiensis TaxID=192387 RepID=UPI0009FAA37A|nr:PTS mannitol transporter subunit IICB [Alicyclobacillus sendaiensis]